ncbi:hypothetical protein EV426DRAFT_575135 [Tirmania nivea]|nr:hypothetical protein EV426DRAFT_575135 [Tirmania nivea]
MPRITCTLVSREGIQKLWELLQKKIAETGTYGYLASNSPFGEVRMNQRAYAAGLGIDAGRSLLPLNLLFLPAVPLSQPWSALQPLSGMLLRVIVISATHGKIPVPLWGTTLGYDCGGNRIILFCQYIYLSSRAIRPGGNVAWSQRECYSIILREVAVALSLQMCTHFITDTPPFYTVLKPGGHEPPAASADTLIHALPRPRPDSPQYLGAGTSKPRPLVPIQVIPIINVYFVVPTSFWCTEAEKPNSQLVRSTKRLVRDCGSTGELESNGISHHYDPSAFEFRKKSKSWGGRSGSGSERPIS